MNDFTREQLLEQVRSIDFQILIDKLGLVDEITQLVENTIDKLPNNDLLDLLDD